MDAWEISILLAGGAFAGALNTLASSGSAITLPLLIFLGVPPGVANGTNRLGVLLGSLSAVISFQKSGSIPWRKTFTLSAPLAVGAIIGARAATYLNDERIQLTINMAIIAALAVLVIGSKRFLFLRESRQNKESIFMLPCIFLVGFWTGFIVLDSATYMILALVMLGSMDVTEANPIKAVFLLFASILSIPIFFLEGQIALVPGIALALGGAVGSWWAAKVAIKPWIKRWIYFLLITVVSIELVGMIIEN